MAYKKPFINNHSLRLRLKKIKVYDQENDPDAEGTIEPSNSSERDFKQVMDEIDDSMKLRARR